MSERKMIPGRAYSDWRKAPNDASRDVRYSRPTDETGKATGGMMATKWHYRRSVLALLITVALASGGCATTRKAETHTYSGETERDSTGTTKTTTKGASTAVTTHAGTTATTFNTKGTTATVANDTAVEVTTVATTYDAAGRAVVVRTEKRTNSRREQKQDYLTGGDIRASLRDTTTSKRDTTGTTKTTAKTHTEAKSKGKTKDVVTTGRPWYFWPIRAGVALVAIGGFVVVGKAVWPWLLLWWRKKKKAEPAETQQLS